MSQASLDFFNESLCKIDEEKRKQVVVLLFLVRIISNPYALGGDLIAVFIQNTSRTKQKSSPFCLYPFTRNIDYNM
ncbi:hypothetical protein L2E82_14397 [Cichorium intybus]|uniref:Uncharacterized protein n=1 Tax=Cichorium intybus TaxID=13427 RepID=A0ACB9F0H9_CICIN|nr:hypothetical protein L2E82_14397 [Cichorium intybus]